MKQIIAFIIIAYKPKLHDLTGLLTALSNQPVIIVDNGGMLVSDDAKKTTVLTQKINAGFGAAANIGIRYTSGLGADWFVILNQDMLLSKKAVSTLVKHLNKLPPSIAGPMSGALDSKRWTTVLPSTRSDYITGSCMAIHEKVVAKIGYFYEPYFLYYEDADYCVRAEHAGFPMIKLEIPNVAHEESVSLGKGSNAHQYYLARNHLFFIKRLAPISVKLYECMRFGKTFAEHVVRKEYGALMGILDFLIGRGGEREHRN